MAESLPAWVVVIVIAAAAGAWVAVFWVTDVGRPPAVGHVAPPPPPVLPAVDVSWVDLELYAQRRPVWAPQ